MGGCSAELKRFKDRLWIFLYFYGVLLVIMGALFVGLASKPEESPMLVATLWIMYGVVYTLLWIINIES